jgi:hypothetical protein
MIEHVSVLLSAEGWAAGEGIEEQLFVEAASSLDRLLV